MSRRSDRRAMEGSAGRRRALLALSLAGLAAGGLAHLLGHGTVAAAAWPVTALVVLVPILVGIVRQLAARQAGVDVIAVLAETRANAQSGLVSECALTVEGGPPLSPWSSFPLVLLDKAGRVLASVPIEKSGLN